jgi:hypothetical protein
LVSEEKVWKNDSGTNRVVKQLVDIKRHIGQEVHHPFFKINLSFGFILRNVETGELRYYHSSQNNSRFFDAPHLIRTEEDLERLGSLVWSRY